MSQIGIDPHTGRTVSGVEQLKARLSRAITTQIGTREKRRNVGGEFRKLGDIANPENQMKATNQIHRIIANPSNELSEVRDPVVLVSIEGAGFRVRVRFNYKGAVVEANIL
ncbi:hypothetical protein HC752_21895 [Vibrio sp. S9_S30]|uniref:hypothetical protein n=1 Tax=Vibrio sp. S9_S30 TaxID=2720226 RepID=UPI0016814289|nr:hypothetical protein [Vibrio sp. S9_S30]MBD1559600.1 hypothetical protein [Vibrio sp. S9_S30]